MYIHVYIIPIQEYFFNYQEIQSYGARITRSKLSDHPTDETPCSNDPGHLNV